MNTNEDLQRKVHEALQSEPLIHAAEIGVTAINGIVTLTGIVNSYARKEVAEEAARNTEGVRAVVENIEVRYNSPGSNTDVEIAQQVVNTFKWNPDIPHDSIALKVEGGWVTLEGEVAWNQQKETAKRAIINLIGVKGVINNIAIKANPEASINIKYIYSALLRSGLVNCEDVQLEANGNTLIVLGTIDSSCEKEEVTKIAWNAPGVAKVENRLRVKYRRTFD